MSKYYVAIVVYKTTSSDKKDTTLYEESTLLIKAKNKPEAEKKVAVAVKERETSYKNEDGATISWSLLKIIDINEMTDESINDITEIYSRHFNDIDSYEKFDPLAGKL
jgi:hypothetical protein